MTFYLHIFLAVVLKAYSFYRISVLTIYLTVKRMNIPSKFSEYVLETCSIAKILTPTTFVLQSNFKHHSFDMLKVLKRSKYIIISIDFGLTIYSIIISFLFQNKRLAFCFVV